MKTLDTLDVKRSTTIMIVGSPGAGKTTLALQFPRPYIFDADNKLRGPVRHLRDVGVDISKIKYDHGTVDHEGKKIPPLSRYQHMAKCLVNASKDPDIDTIIVDSGTAIQEYLKNDIFRQRVPKPRVPLVTNDNVERAQLTEPEWGIYGRFWNNLVTELQTCGKITIFTMHFEHRQIGDDSNGIIEQALAVQGQTRYKLAGLFSDVINPYVETKGFGANTTVSRWLRTVPTNQNDQRGLQSSLALPPVMELDATKIVEAFTK